MDTAIGPTIISTMSASRVPRDPVPQPETTDFAHAVVDGHSSASASAADADLPNFALAGPALPTGVATVALSKVPVTLGPSSISWDAQCGAPDAVTAAALSPAALSTSESNYFDAGTGHAAIDDPTRGRTESGPPVNTRIKANDVSHRDAEQFALRGGNESDPDILSNGLESGSVSLATSWIEDLPGSAAPFHKRTLDDIGVHSSSESPTKRPRVALDPMASGEDHVDVQTRNAAGSPGESNSLSPAMLSSAQNSGPLTSSNASAITMDNHGIDDRESDRTLNSDASPALRSNLTSDAPNESGASYPCVGPAKEGALEVESYLRSMDMVSKVTNTAHSQLDLSTMSSGAGEAERLSSSSQAQAEDREQKNETESAPLDHTRIPEVAARDKMEISTADTRVTAAFAGGDVDGSPDSPTFCPSKHDMRVANGEAPHHSIPGEISSSPGDASEGDGSPDSTGSACTNSPTDVFAGGTDSAVSTEQKDASGSTGADGGDRLEIRPPQEEILVSPVGSPEAKLLGDEVAADEGAIAGSAFPSSSEVVTTVSRPPSLGVTLRSAPVDGLLPGDSSAGQAPGERENHDLASNEQMKPSPPRKPRKEVRWVADENLAEIHYIDTRLQLIQNWDPESEITLPFAPSTLAQLRAQAKMQESGANDSDRPSPSSGTLGAVGLPLRSAPSENDFEAAKRREREMELERSRQAKQQLQAKLDAMVPKCDWRSPFVVILPSECRRDIDGLSDDPSDESRILTLPWMSESAAVIAPPLPASPPPNKLLESEGPPVEIVVTNASFNSSEVAPTGGRCERTGGNDRAGRPPPGVGHLDPNSYQPLHSNESSAGSRTLQRDAFRGRSKAAPMQSQSGAPFGVSNGPSRPVTSMPPQHVMNNPMLGNVSHGQGLPPSGIGIPGLMIHPQALQQLLSQMRQGGLGHGMPGMMPPGPPPFHPPGMIPQLPMQPLGMGMPPPHMMGLPAPPPPHMVNMQHRQPQNQQPVQQQNMPSSRNRKVCRFFNTKQGCRDGPNCAFLHIPPKNSANSSSTGW